MAVELSASYVTTSSAITYYGTARTVRSSPHVSVTSARRWQSLLFMLAWVSWGTSLLERTVSSANTGSSETVNAAESVIGTWSQNRH